MNRPNPSTVPIDRTLTRFAVAVVVMLALLPLASTNATALGPGQLQATSPTIDLTMHSSPPAIWEPGTKASFGIELTNTYLEPVTITSATQALDGGPETDITVYGDPILHTTCDDAIGTMLGAGETYHCVFIVFIGGDPGDLVTNVATLTVEDGHGRAASAQAHRAYEILDATPNVTLTMHSSPPAIWEPGTKASFGIELTNTYLEPVTITSATQALDGGPETDITVYGDPILHTTCDDAIGTMLGAGETYHCVFIVFIGGDPGDLVTNVATLTVEDNEGNTAAPQADVSYEIRDATPRVTVTKNVDRSSIPEPGAEVTTTASVTNTYAEPVRITSVLDTIDGGFPFDVTAVGGPVLTTTCDDAVGTELALDEQYSCAFTMHTSGNAGTIVEDTVAFTVSDNEDNLTTETADAWVRVTDAMPTIEVRKTAGTDSIDAPGGEVDFTVEVTNTSVEEVTVTRITDRIGAGDPFDVTTDADPVLATTCRDTVGRALAPGESTNCTFTLEIISDEATAVTDTVRVAAADDEENLVVAEDDATVDVNAPPKPEPTPPAPSPTAAAPAQAAQAAPAAVQPAGQAAQASTAPTATAPALASTGRNTTEWAVTAFLLVLIGLAVSRLARHGRIRPEG